MTEQPERVSESALEPNEPNINETNPTPTTKVNLCLNGERTVISIRIKPEVKEAFTSCCKQLGLSTCHVAEGLFTGFVYGITENVNKVNLGRMCTVDLTLVRDVKRIHRYAHTRIDEEVITETVPCKADALRLAQLPSRDKQFRGILASWELHDENWRMKCVALASKWIDVLDSAKLVLEKVNSP